MIPRDAQRIEEALSRLLDLDEPERRHALEQIRTDDPVIGVEVGRLLAAMPAAESFFAQFPSEANDHGFPLDGRRVGAYRITGELGRGGMGAVYRALRDDGQFQRQVAIKFVNVLVAGGEARRRFEREKSILAGLRHPNIAQLLDAGVMEDATPYIVMEQVEGTPIDRYCRERELPVAARIRLFQQICAAVDFTHRNLIVHRDIKPGNILVTSEGVPKLLDFGISRVVSEDGEARVTTAIERRVMTLNYSSPEQVRGEPVSTSTDIYSLGLLLYELLAGRPAYSLSGAPAEEILRQVLERDPPPPGAGADLDQIVAMAIRKVPAERYASVAALSADLDNYLAGRPVAARTGGWQYRSRKFLVRHKWSMTATATAVMLAAAGVWAILSQSRLAARRFEEIRTLSRTVLVDMPGQLPALSGNIGFRQQMIAEGLRYLDNASRDAGSDTRFLLELAQGYIQLGQLQMGAGANMPVDRPAALSSFRRAQALFEQAPVQSVEDPAARREYIRLLAHIGNAQGGKGLERDTARRLASDWYASDPASREAAIAYALSLVCETCPASSTSGGPDLQDLRRAAGALDSIQSRGPQDDLVDALTADVHYRLAYRAVWIVDRDEMMRHAPRAQQLYNRLLASRPNETSRISNAGLAEQLVGEAELLHKNLKAARTALERSIQLLVGLHGADQRDIHYRPQAAVSYMILSELDMEENRPQDAESSVDSGLALLQGFSESMLANPAVRAVLAGLYTHRALARTRLAARVTACADFARGNDLYQGLVRPGSEQVPYLRRLITLARNGAEDCRGRR